MFGKKKTEDFKKLKQPTDAQIIVQQVNEEPEEETEEEQEDERPEQPEEKKVITSTKAMDDYKTKIAAIEHYYNQMAIIHKELGRLLSEVLV